MSHIDNGATARYAIRVDPAFRGLFAVLGAGANRDYLDVGPDKIEVRLGWLYRATIDRSAITAAKHHADMHGGWGAHGWRGRWLVNGSSKGVVELDLTDRQSASLLGFWPLALDTLYVSLVDPDGFLATLGS
jgi:hypothetical protein